MPSMFKETKREKQSRKEQETAFARVLQPYQQRKAQERADDAQEVRHHDLVDEAREAQELALEHSRIDAALEAAIEDVERSDELLAREREAQIEEKIVRREQSEQDPPRNADDRRTTQEPPWPEREAEAGCAYERLRQAKQVGQEQQREREQVSSQRSRDADRLFIDFER